MFLTLLATFIRMMTEFYFSERLDRKCAIIATEDRMDWSSEVVATDSYTGPSHTFYNKPFHILLYLQAPHCSLSHMYDPPRLVAYLSTLRDEYSPVSDFCVAFSNRAMLQKLPPAQAKLVAPFSFYLGCAAYDRLRSSVTIG